MFCSTVIPTVGRTSLLRAVDSVLQQSLPVDFEVIIVNDSGAPLQITKWRDSARARVIHTNRSERSVARNAGAAIATGEYLHFLDDDDWLLPGALRTFWELANTTGAAWLAGNTSLVNRAGAPIGELRNSLAGNCFIQVLSGEWIPIGATLIKADTFFEIGGFDNRLTTSEDMDLYRNLALHTDLAKTSYLVASITLGKEGSTTDYPRLAENSRWAREKLFSNPDLWKRMWNSATSSYWRGRIVRAYLTSMVWNLQHKNIIIGAQRALWVLFGLVQAGPHIFTFRFWRAVCRPYLSDSFKLFRDEVVETKYFN